VPFYKPREAGLDAFAAQAKERVDGLLGIGADRRISDVARSVTPAIALTFLVPAKLFPKLAKRFGAAGPDRYTLCVPAEAHAAMTAPPCATPERMRTLTLKKLPDGDQPRDEIFVRDGKAVLERREAESLYTTDPAAVSLRAALFK
jgi:hypothetical protein